MISLSSPVKTRAHNWPAGFKMSGLCIATACLFAMDDMETQLAAFLIVAILYVLPGRAFLLAGLHQLKVLWPFVVVVGLWHVWADQTSLGASIVLRMISTVGLANLFTMTTRLADMLDVVKAVTRPFQRFGLNSQVLEIAIALVIRLTPTLLQKGEQLSLSWRARSPRAPTWRIILPFTVLALDDADHVEEALRARGGFNSLEET